MQHDLITLITAARLNGDADGTYRSVISQHLRKVGRKYGRERMVDLHETLLLRLVTEVTSGNLNLGQAAQYALGLFPYMRAMATGRLGRNEGSNVYAVFAWGLRNGKQQRKGYVCGDDGLLASCILDLARAGWPNLRVINLRRLMNETYCGWVLATQGRDKLDAMLQQQEGDDSPEVEEAMRAFIAELEQRLRGARRSDQPAGDDDDWEAWMPPGGTPSAATTTPAVEA